MVRCVFRLLVASLVIVAIAGAHAAAAPTITAITPAESAVTARAQIDAVGRYEKFEVEVNLTATFDNPFDPEQVDLSADFTAPSGASTHIWGFFDPASSRWLVRFAPTEPGVWRYVVTLRDRTGATASAPASFRCVDTVNNGFVRIAANRRYFQTSDGASFYGVGLWYNDAFTEPGSGVIQTPDLDRLQHLGVNLIAFYPSLLETDETGLGRYDAARVQRLDELVTWCEDRDLRISWNLVFHANISAAVWGEGNAEYGHNPYRKIAQARDYFDSEDVWRYQQQLNRYILARWGYSHAIMLWFVVDEINGTEGWTEGDQDAALAWCRRMRDFYHEHDPYGRATTGTQSGGIDQWWPDGYEIFDVAARELYEAQGHPMPDAGSVDDRNHPLQASYRNYAVQTRALWQGFAKPAMIGETGYDWTYYEPGTPGYLATYHNALWATLATGGAATPLWWAYSPYITDGLLTSHVTAFARFVRGVDFAGGDWSPAPVETSGGDAWAMRSGAHAFGWAVNPVAGIAGASITVTDMPVGEYDVHVYRTWRGEFLPPISASVADGTLTFSIPQPESEDGPRQLIGDDAAFKITPRGERP